MSQDKYYQLLRENYGSREAVLTEIINLEAILQLPKGTEHFVSDIHGEFNAFDHVLRNGSGSVKEKLKECLEDDIDINELAVLIYYPEEKILQVKEELSLSELNDWYEKNIMLLTRVTNYASRKYTRSKVRKALPQRFSYISEELLTEVQDQAKYEYYHAIIDKIIELNQAPALIHDLSETIQRLVVDHLHVVGDIYDRGPSPDLIMERLIDYHSVDIQWGNHDMVWIAAVSGSLLSIINLIRISARYANIDTLEEGYGINLRPIVEYAKKYYEPLEIFAPKLLAGDNSVSETEKRTLNLVQQATAILQFKLEGQLIVRRKCFKMQDRAMLSKVNYEDSTIEIGGVSYELKNFSIPTVDIDDPCRLTIEEEAILEKLKVSFQSSDRLRKHMDFLMEKGSMYLCYNDNLLIHGCIPLHENGDYKSLTLEGRHYSGKDLLDYFERQVRVSYRNPQVKDDIPTDLMWYLWTGECSSLFGKDAMTTFERYYIEDKATHEEMKNSYYKLRNEEDVCRYILRTFELPESGHIINGHTPVKEKDGENPIKANGHLVVIDGGFAKAYQKQTGLAGYTLLSNSYGIQLAAHQPFTSIEDTIKTGFDILSTKRLVDKVDRRTTVSQTNIGKKLIQERKDLEELYMNF